MTSLATLTALLLALHPTVGNNDDRFSYKYGASITNGREFGVKHWDQVTCDNPSECVSVMNQSWNESCNNYLLTNNVLLTYHRILSFYTHSLDGQTDTSLDEDGI